MSDPMEPWRRRARAAAAAAAARLPSLRTRALPALPTLKLPTFQQRRPQLPILRRPALPTLPTLPTLPSLPTNLQAHLEETRARATARRRRVAVAIALVLLVLWLWRRCDEPPHTAPALVAEAPVCPAVPECPTSPGKPPKKKPSSTKRLPRRDVTAAQPRDLFAVAQLRTPPWLAALRMQVSARSLALGGCFTGAEKPGAIRLIATVTPSSGLLADVVLEPLAGGPALVDAQRRCLIQTLTTPAYWLPIEGERDVDLATRVSLILEF
jgi:hypothetical protein